MNNNNNYKYSILQKCIKLKELLKKCIYFLFKGVLGLCCCPDFLQLQQGVGGHSLLVMQGRLIAVAAVVAEHGLQGAQASAVAAPGLWSTLNSCSTGALFPHDLCLRHYQADSLPLNHGRPPTPPKILITPLFKSSYYSCSIAFPSSMSLPIQLLLFTM